MRIFADQRWRHAFGEMQLDDNLFTVAVFLEASHGQSVLREVATTERFEFSAQALIGHLSCRVVVEFHQYLSAE